MQEDEENSKKTLHVQAYEQTDFAYEREGGNSLNLPMYRVYMKMVLLMSYQIISFRFDTMLAIYHCMVHKFLYAVFFVVLNGHSNLM